jgi:primosomal protein N' (replication factor Y)
MAALTGPAPALGELLTGARLPSSAQAVGPVPVDADTERVLLRVPRADSAELAAALKAAAALRSARRSAAPVRVALDPLDIV